MFLLGCVAWSMKGTLCFNCKVPAFSFLAFCINASCLKDMQSMTKRTSRSTCRFANNPLLRKPLIQALGPYLLEILQHLSNYLPTPVLNPRCGQSIAASSGRSFENFNF